MILQQIVYTILLMVQGFGGTIDKWNQTFIGILATKYHVYTYDHRGMGYSSDNNATPTIAQYADDAAGLMTALGYDSMNNVYGVSMGSSVSQQLVISHPERVRWKMPDDASRKTSKAVQKTPLVPRSAEYLPVFSEEGGSLRGVIVVFRLPASLPC